MNENVHQYEYGYLLRSDPTLTNAEAEQQIQWSPRRLRPRFEDGKDSGKSAGAADAKCELTTA